MPKLVLRRQLWEHSSGTKAGRVRLRAVLDSGAHSHSSKARGRSPWCVNVYATVRDSQPDTSGR